MALTDAQRKARNKWLKEKVETLNLRVPKGEKARIQAHAAARGESTNAFIYRAVQETIQREEEA